MNNINALKLLIMTLYNMYGVQTFIENGKIAVGSSMYADVKSTFDSYTGSVESKNILDTKVNEFYTGLNISEDELVSKDIMKVYFESGFKHSGAQLINKDIGFGQYAIIKEDESADEESCYIEFNPKYLNSKYHNGTGLTDDAVTSNVNEEEHTGINSSASETSTNIEGADHPNGGFSYNSGAVSDSHDTHNGESNSSIENGSSDVGTNKSEKDTFRKDLLFGIAVIGFYISVVTFFNNKRK